MGGHDDWAYDNERPAHEAETGAYRIDVEPVSNGDYAAFLAAGGWPEPPLSRAGWCRGPGAASTAGARTPLRARAARLVGRGERAYAEWAGKRLPTEAEERAAKLGALGRVGEVWEWTPPDFAGYPGFRAFLTRSTPGGVLRPGVQGATRRVVGNERDGRPPGVSQLGPSHPPADLRRPPLREPGMSDGAALATLQVDIYLTPEDRLEALREDVRRGLTSTPKALPPKWFYDERGSALFEETCGP